MQHSVCDLERCVLDLPYNDIATATTTTTLTPTLVFQTMLASGSVDNFLQPQVSCFLIGGAAATAGAMISKILHKEQCISQTSAKELAKVALEGALLFGIFQITLDLCEHFVPDNFNFPLGFTLFENVLKKLTGLEATK